MPTRAGEPIVIDLGKARSKQIKDLKRGKGRIVSRVDQALAEVRDQIEGVGAQLLPIIVVYRKKRRRRSRDWSLGFFGW